MRGTARNGLAGLLVVAAVAWLALPRAAVGQPGGTDYQTMKSRNLAFDLNVDAEQKNTIHSIELYVSRENGGVWELGATATPDAKSIPYVAKDDGLYLVNMVIVYKSGVRDPADLSPHQLRLNTSPSGNQSYAELYEWLEPGQLLAEPPQSWAGDWAAASADTFRPPSRRT